MKTFKEFCVEAYQLDEFDIKSKLSKVKSAVTSNPVVKGVTNHPLARGAAGAYNIYFTRLSGLEKITSDSADIGPIERTLGGISAFSPPGISQVAGFAHHLIGGPRDNPHVVGGNQTLKKLDKKVQKGQTAAYRANPNLYGHMTILRPY